MSLFTELFNASMFSGLQTAFQCYLFFCIRYSYAVVGINMTSTAYHLLQDGTLKTHLYNHVERQPTVEDFHQVYCKFTSIQSMCIMSPHSSCLITNPLRPKAIVFPSEFVSSTALYLGITVSITQGPQYMYIVSMCAVTGLEIIIPCTCTATGAL